ncbi:hypothetical protein PV11_03130 [Exophiala sideris]|uniref:Uncharacterized protein n=1 Tax=Exophiala sideris TaxID=1016849 RepID=A0A0D1XHE3_9EURO|nr:hypothetical protein PV11_03130 [Exophiala sideris]
MAAQVVQQTGGVPTPQSHPAAAPTASNETDASGALPTGTAPIDETYYHCSGPATAFEQEFDPHVCSYDDLFTHFQPTIEQANQPHGDGDEAANFIHEAIQTVIAEPDCEGVEDVVLLCMIMQESTGNCYVPVSFEHFDGEHGWR